MTAADARANTQAAFARWKAVALSLARSGQLDVTVGEENALATLKSFRLWPRDAWYRDCGIWCGMADGFSILYSWRRPLVYRAVRWLLTHIRPWAHTWNDYWMARWMITREQHCVREIHWRALHLLQDPVDLDKPELHNLQFSANWMLTSMMEQNEEFKLAAHWAALLCPICRGKGTTLIPQ